MRRHCLRARLQQRQAALATDIDQTQTAAKIVVGKIMNMIINNVISKPLLVQASVASATLSVGSTPAEAGAASVTDTDQTQVAAKIVVGKIKDLIMNNVIYKTLLDELLVRSPRDKGQGITATFARRDAKLIDENKSTPDRTVFLSATVYFLDLSKDTYAHFRVCVCVCCVWCVCASGARWFFVAARAQAGHRRPAQSSVRDLPQSYCAEWPVRRDVN